MAADGEVGIETDVEPHPPDGGDTYVEKLARIEYLPVEAGVLFEEIFERARMIGAEFAAMQAASLQGEERRVYCQLIDTRLARLEDAIPYLDKHGLVDFTRRRLAEWLDPEVWDAFPDRKHMAIFQEPRGENVVSFPTRNGSGGTGPGRAA